MRKVLGLLLSVMTFATAAADEQLTSPDGNYVFTFDQQGGKMTYSLQYKGKSVINGGELGLQVDNHLVEQAMGVTVDKAPAWTADMTMTGVDRTEKDTTWTPVYGECNRIRDNYREMTLHFKKSDEANNTTGGYNRSKNYLLDIIVRAYNEGVAVRYHFPEAVNGLFMRVTKEFTSFPFAPGTTAYQEHWAQAPFIKSGLKAEEWDDESERPLLLKTADGLNVALLEADMHDYVRGKFKVERDNVVQISMYQDADVITPYDLPWRLIMVGDKAVDLINNKQVVLNLNAPSKGDFSFCKPGKVFRSGLRREQMLESIHFAHNMNFQYIEIDASWYGPEMKVSSDASEIIPKWNITLQELCDSAKAYGIGVWIYVNQRALAYQLDKILPIYKKVGIKGLKFGFVQVGGQHWTTWLHNAVKRCAEYGLMVDIHDEYRPTGWSRTYPNLMTQEGIGGNEEMPDARHNTILPFTRFLCGPADYTPCYFNGRVKNTKAHQLAMAVVYYTPIEFLFWYDTPSLYRGERELDFWKAVPTTWDESIALDGEPEQYIIQARRNGNDWYIGAMNGMDERDIIINTDDFLTKGKKYNVEMYTDDPALNTRTNVRTTVTTIKAGKQIKLHLQPSGGAALRFVEK